MVAEVLLGVSEVLVCSDDVTVKLWSEVVVDILGWVMPLGLGCLSSELESVGFHALSKLKRSVVVDDVGVNAEVWNWVVDLVTEWLLLVLVLGATSRGADWVGVNVDISIKLDIIDNPLVLEVLLGITKVLHGGNDITVQGWVEVVVNILGWVVPLLLRGSGTNLEFMTDHAFSESQGGEVIVDVVISAEVWNSIVDFVTECLLLVLVLSATSGGADWIRLEVSGGIHVRIELNEGWHLVRWPGVLSLVVVKLVGINSWKNPSTISVSLNGPSSNRLLSIGDVSLGESDVLVFTEVWNEVVSWRIIWWWGGVELMTELLLSKSNDTLGVLDVLVLSEMWNEVVSLWWVWSVGVELMMLALFSISDVLLGVLDLSILTEMWDEVVSWWGLWWIERGLQNMTKFLLSVSGVLEGGFDVGVSSEVWHEIVDWVVLWVNPFWESGSAAPWNGTWVRSVGHFNCRGC